jgi:hypothetical protein
MSAVERRLRELGDDTGAWADYAGTVSEPRPLGPTGRPLPAALTIGDVVACQAHLREIVAAGDRVRAQAAEAAA